MAAHCDPSEMLEVCLPPPPGADDATYVADRLEPTVVEGRLEARKDVLAQGLWCRASHVWVVDKNTGRVLMQKRSVHKDTFPGCWDISCAGHCEVNEPADATVARELEEELGHVLSAEERSALRLVCVYPSAKSGEGGWNAYEYIFVLPVDNGEQCFPRGGARNAGEVDALRWVALDNLRALLAGEQAGAVPRQQVYRDHLFDAIRASLYVAL